MKDKFLRRHFGFTLPEVIIAITIMGVMAAAVTMSSNVGKQSAKAEAEKVAGFIQRHVNRADKLHSGFALIIEPNVISVSPDVYSKDLRASSGCSYESNKKFYYNYGEEDNLKIISTRPRRGDNEFYVAVKNENDTYYVILSPDKKELEVN